MYDLVKPPTVVGYVPHRPAGSPLQQLAGGHAGWARAALTQADKGAGKTGGAQQRVGHGCGWRVAEPPRVGGGRRSGQIRRLTHAECCFFSFSSMIRCKQFIVSWRLDGLVRTRLPHADSRAGSGVGGLPRV